ncbi:hypothetical protein N2152v2_011055 [Parachlorella kessleri]
MTSLRKSLQRFAEDLQLFSSQLSQETQELKRNVELRPVTGATHFRHCLEDINDRLTALGEELQALEGVSLDAISLEELVGHCVALYQNNHAAIAQLEQRLQQYGYRDLYAPLPPDNPLDMLMLRAPAAAQHAQAAIRQQFLSPGPSPLPQAGPTREPLEHITNSMAAISLQQATEPPGSMLHQRTVMKAMAPMTAAKARVRSDTPSSLSSSPFEAMSPSMRELLGKYASSTGGPPTQYSGTPLSHSSTPPLMGHLTPAFAAAHSASEHGHGAGLAAGGRGAEHTPAGSEGPAGEVTPEGFSGGGGPWAADPTMYNALTATAKKLANKPDFLQDIRQRFPHIAASTERLLASVEKQHQQQGPGSEPRCQAGDGSCGLDGRGGHGPMGALAAAVAAAQQAQQTAQQEQRVISSRQAMPPMHRQEDPAPAGSLTPMRATSVGTDAAGTPSTEQLLSRAYSAASKDPGSQPPSAAGQPLHLISYLASCDGSAGSGGGEGHNVGVAQLGSAPLGSSMAIATSIARATAAQLAASTAAAGPATEYGRAGTAQQSADRSRPDLQEAIEAALRRSAAPQASSGVSKEVVRSQATAAAGAPAAPGSNEAASIQGQIATSVVCAAASVATSGGGVADADRPMPAVPVGRQRAGQAPPPSAPQQFEVPPLRLVADQEYQTLPTFIKGQLSLDEVNSTLASVHAAVSEKATTGGLPGFTLEDLVTVGLAGKAKVFINSIVKLGRAQLKVVYGQGTVYLLL